MRAYMKSVRVPEAGDEKGLGLEQFGYEITGSVAFGCANLKSDIDLMFDICKRDSVLAHLKCLGKEVIPSDYNNGVKCIHEGVVVNCIFLHPEEFPVWSKATKAAVGMGIKGLQSRKKRHALFETMRGAIKSALIGGVCETPLEYLLYGRPRKEGA